jgi:hypothetical protein
MLADGRRLRVISSTETRVTLGLATIGERGNGEVPGVLFAKRYRAAKQAEFQWISADRSACERYFCAFDKAQYHQPLNHWIGRIDCSNDTFLSAP